MTFRLACLVFMLAPAVWGAEAIKNPMRDFLRHFDVENPRDVVRTELDLNNDGVPEILLTYNNLVNGRQGNIWVLYSSLPGGGYARFDEVTGGGPISFHQKASAFRKNRSGTEILRYSPGGAGRGAISSFQLGPSGVEETQPREIVPQGSDAATYEALFENPATKLVFIVEDARKLRRKHLPIREWLRGMTLLKWCLYIVGILVALFVLLLILRGALGMMRAVKA